SRSTKRPSRSSKLSVLTCGSASCSASAASMPSSLRALSLSSVGCSNINISLSWISTLLLGPPALGVLASQAGQGPHRLADEFAHRVECGLYGGDMFLVLLAALALLPGFGAIVEIALHLAE